jgi:hypothetical protein
MAIGMMTTRMRHEVKGSKGRISRDPDVVVVRAG